MAAHEAGAKASITLDVAVVGAGIAGLSAAIGLSLAGHRVEIFERSTFANEVGAAIHVCPNASRILKAWGFDFGKHKALVVKQTRLLESRSATTLHHGTWDQVEQQYKSPWYFIHRVDLHNGLKDLAAQMGVVTHLSAGATHVDPESGTLTLANGQTHTKDLIIAADGVHSIFTSVVNEQSTPAEETGQSAFRFLIPMPKLREAGLAEALHLDEDVGIFVAVHRDRRLVWYPCRNGELLNVVAIHPERPTDLATEAWNVDGRLNDLLDEYKDFHPDFVKLCSHAEDLKLWKLLYRHPIKAWYRGNVALAGDAAHPMLPHQGQGGAQAIEDAGALNVVFSDVQDKSEVPRRLEVYQITRRNRAAAIQVLSNAGQDHVERVRDEAQKFIDGPVPGVTRAKANPAEFQAFNFGYDVMDEARANMQKTFGMATKA